MAPFPFPGPIPFGTNFPINAQYYQPSQFFITAIATGSATTTVTTSVNHNYVIGQTVRLIVPEQFGSYQLDEQTGQVIQIPAANQVVLNINSQGVTPFVSSTSPTQPQILAIGDVNSGSINANGRTNTGTFIPGSFINISP